MHAPVLGEELEDFQTTLNAEEVLFLLSQDARSDAMGLLMKLPARMAVRVAFRILENSPEIASRQLLCVALQREPLASQLQSAEAERVGRLSTSLDLFCKVGAPPQTAVSEALLLQPALLVESVVMNARCAALSAFFAQRPWMRDDSLLLRYAKKALLGGSGGEAADAYSSPASSEKRPAEGEWPWLLTGDCSLDDCIRKQHAFPALPNCDAAFGLLDLCSANNPEVAAQCFQVCARIFECFEHAVSVHPVAAATACVAPSPLPDGTAGAPPLSLSETPRSASPSPLERGSDASRSASARASGGGDGFGLGGESAFAAAYGALRGRGAVAFSTRLPWLQTSRASPEDSPPKCAFSGEACPLRRLPLGALLSLLRRLLSFCVEKCGAVDGVVSKAALLRRLASLALSLRQRGLAMPPVAQLFTAEGGAAFCRELVSRGALDLAWRLCQCFLDSALQLLHAPAVQSQPPPRRAELEGAGEGVSVQEPPSSSLERDAAEMLRAAAFFPVAEARVSALCRVASGGLASAAGELQTAFSLSQMQTQLLQRLAPPAAAADSLSSKIPSLGNEVSPATPPSAFDVSKRRVSAAPHRLPPAAPLLRHPKLRGNSASLGGVGSGSASSAPETEAADSEASLLAAARRSRAVAVFVCARTVDEAREANEESGSEALRLWSLREWRSAGSSCSVGSRESESAAEGDDCHREADLPSRPPLGRRERLALQRTLMALTRRGGSQARRVTTEREGMPSGVQRQSKVRPSTKGTLSATNSTASTGAAASAALPSSSLSVLTRGVLFVQLFTEDSLAALLRGLAFLAAHRRSFQRTFPWRVETLVCNGTWQQTRRAPLQNFKREVPDPRWPPFGGGKLEARRATEAAAALSEEALRHLLPSLQEPLQLAVFPLRGRETSAELQILWAKRKHAQFLADEAERRAAESGASESTPSALADSPPDSKEECKAALGKSSQEEQQRTGGESSRRGGGGDGASPAGPSVCTPGNGNGHEAATALLRGGDDSAGRLTAEALRKVSEEFISRRLLPTAKGPADAFWTQGISHKPLAREGHATDSEETRTQTRTQGEESRRGVCRLEEADAWGAETRALAVPSVQRALPCLACAFRDGKCKRLCVLHVESRLACEFLVNKSTGMRRGRLSVGQSVFVGRRSAVPLRARRRVRPAAERRVVSVLGLCFQTPLPSFDVCIVRTDLSDLCCVCWFPWGRCKRRFR